MHLSLRGLKLLLDFIIQSFIKLPFFFWFVVVVVVAFTSVVVTLRPLEEKRQQSFFHHQPPLQIAHCSANICLYSLSLYILPSPITHFTAQSFLFHVGARNFQCENEMRTYAVWVKRIAIDHSMYGNIQ